MKISKIFLTHYHGDHILGLPGLLQSMSLNGRESKLTIYGPKGLHKLKDAIYSLGYCAIEYPVEFREINTGIIEDNDKYFIQAQRVKHNVPTLAYAVEEKKKPKFLREKALELGVPEGVPAQELFLFSKSFRCLLKDHSAWIHQVSSIL